MESKLNQVCAGEGDGEEERAMEQTDDGGDEGVETIEELLARERGDKSGRRLEAITGGYEGGG